MSIDEAQAKPVELIHWEIAIKVSLGKYPLAVPFEMFFQEAIHGSGMAILPIEVRHDAVLSSSPMHHRDRGRTSSPRRGDDTV